MSAHSWIGAVVKAAWFRKRPQTLDSVRSHIGRKYRTSGRHSCIAVSMAGPISTLLRAAQLLLAHNASTESILEAQLSLLASVADG